MAYLLRTITLIFVPVPYAMHNHCQHHYEDHDRSNNPDVLSYISHAEMIMRFVDSFQSGDISTHQADVHSAASNSVLLPAAWFFFVHVITKNRHRQLHYSTNNVKQYRLRSLSRLHLLTKKPFSSKRSSTNRPETLDTNG